MPRIYLAGPEVFFSDPLREARIRKETCSRHGLEGLFPTDSTFPKEGEGEQLGKAIYMGNVELLDRCDGVIANMMPFRGPSMDVGTAFEIGYAIAKQKPVFGWSPEHTTTYVARCQARNIDDGMTVEDFRMYDNLMVAVPLRDGVVHPSFEAAVLSAAASMAAA